MYEQKIFIKQTQNGQLAACEEIFTKFDKKCIGLEAMTAFLMEEPKYYSRDCFH